MIRFESFVLLTWAVKKTLTTKEQKKEEVKNHLLN